ncbi:MAG: AAA family ATPase [Alphaproteobacteria bacterium]|jgi:adenylate kinase family enzyme|nr:AAA family ATPase [Alphaproteobacteria bacterium]
MQPQRIFIVGTSGAGKSTLAQMLGKRFQLPVIHLDNLAHEPGWILKNETAIAASFHELAEQPRWVVDGVYFTLATTLRQRADWLIFLDYGTLFSLRQVIQRHLLHRLKLRTRADLAPGFEERLTWDFLFWVWRWRRDKRQRWVDELAQYPAEKVLCFTSRRELMRWFKQL